MEALIQLALKTQPIWGCIRLFLFLVSWPIVIGLLNSYLDKDKLSFNCVPKPSTVTKQLCYDSYSSAMSPLPTLTFAYITTGVLGGFWVVIIFCVAKILTQLRREQDSTRKECQSRRFWCCFLIHLFLELGFLIIMTVVFFHYQTLSLPKIYMCTQGNVTVHIPKQNVTCNDQYYRNKSDLNFGIIAIMALSMILCVLAIVHSLWKRKNFYKQLIDWGSGWASATETELLDPLQQQSRQEEQRSLENTPHSQELVRADMNGDITDVTDFPQEPTLPPQQAEELNNSIQDPIREQSPQDEQRSLENNPNSQATGCEATGNDDATNAGDPLRNQDTPVEEGRNPLEDTKCIWHQRVTDIDGFQDLLRDLKMELDPKRELGGDYRSLAGAFEKNMTYIYYLGTRDSPVEELLRDCNPTLRNLHSLVSGEKVKRSSVAEKITTWVEAQGCNCSDCGSLR